MYNTDLPRRADLPSANQLRRSTFIAGISAAFLLITVVLPSEYGIDPTRIGRLLGLTEMGEIKTQLSAEAVADPAAPAATTPDQSAILARLDRIEALLVAPQDGARESAPIPAPAETSINAPPAPESEQYAAPTATPDVASAEPPPEVNGRSDEASFTLPPGEGVEVKLVMRQGARASFAWTANGSVVNYDTHGDGGGQSVSYKKGRSVAEEEGVLEAAFDGNHGWFWRNRTSEALTLTVRTNGDYTDFKRP